VHNSKIKRISLAVCLALMPFAADAAGLGKMTVLSGLGEPLSAEIDISASKDELSALSARIAPAETYADQGIERGSSLGAIKVELVSKPNGSPVLKLSTAQPIDDPFLDMLVQVDWPTGRLLREYTALLDPPGYGDRAGASAEAPVAVEVAPVVKASSTSPSKKNTIKRQSAVARAPKSETAPPEADSGDGYLTQRGDTLRSVARKMQVDDVSLEQMLVGLYRANRSAFMHDNMNQLKVGQIMRAPREDEVKAIPQQEALQEIRAHTSDWNSYRNTLAGTVAQSAPAKSESPQQAVSGKITTPAEDKATPQTAGPRDVVKLSKAEAEPAKAGATEAKGGAAEDKLRALEEESTAQEKAIKDVNDRIAFFEKQIQDMQKLLMVQNQILADLQKGKPVQQPMPEVPPAVPPAPEPVPMPQAQQPEPAPAPVATEPAPKPSAPKPPVEAAPEPTLVDALMEDPVLLAGAGGLVLLGGGAWLFLRNRRRKSLDNFEQGILASGGLATDTVLGASEAGEAAETSFMSDFAHREGGGMIDTSDVDPISEAEVYMAYGRDAQAEEILKDAISKEPKRLELHQKLLEIYASRKDAEAFETLAGELYATLGATDPVWLKAAELGRVLDAANPMYASGEAQPVPSAEPIPVAMMEAPASSQVEETPAQDSGLDFDLGMLGAEESPAAPVEAAVESAAAPESLPEFELPEAAPEEVAEELSEESSSMDLNLGLPEPAAEENVQLGAADLGLPEAELTAADEEIPETAALELPELGTGAETVVAEAMEMPALEEMTLSAPAVEEAAIESVEEISFDLPKMEVAAAEPDVATMEELALPELPEMPAEIAAAELANEVVEEISFDLPETVETAEEVAAFEAETAPVPAEEDTLAAEIEALDMSLELPVDMDVSQSETAPASAETETESAEISGLDFNFDADVEAEPEPEMVAAETAAVLPDLDLSGISLDVAEVASTPEAESAAEEITLSSGESPDVETKLDLVTAYMDMGDTEGARELLEEVLKEGGPSQRERAQSMLDSLA
jgi:pilus assembly protein FimV